MPKDTFDPAEAPVPTSVEQVEIILRVSKRRDEAGNQTGVDYYGHYNFTPVDQNGQRIVSEHREGHLINHLTDTQRTALANFLDNLLTRAQGTIPA